MQWFQLTPDGSQPVDPTAFHERAMRAAAALGLATRATIRQTLDRDDGCIILITRGSTLMCLPDGDPDLAERVAHAARATITPVDPPDILDQPGLTCAHPVIPWGSRLSRTARESDTGDPASISPPEHGFVAITIRRMGWLEKQRVENWISDEFNAQADTCKLRDSGTGLARITVAAPSRRDALDHAIQAAQALNMGLDTFRAHDHTADTLWPLLWTLPIPLALTVMPLIGPPPTILLALLAATLLAAIGLAASWRHPLAALTILYTGLLAQTGHLTTILPAIPAWAAWLAAAAWLNRPTPDPLWRQISMRPRHWWAPWARRRHADSSDNKTRMGGNDDNPSGTLASWPVHRSTMIITPTALAGALTPRTGATVTGLTRADDELAAATGPLIGTDAAGRPIRLPEPILYGGIAVVGEPGSGKSNLMHGLLAWTGAHRRPGDVIIDFEVKGGGGLPILGRLIDGRVVHARLDGMGPGIDMLGDGDPIQRADRFATLLHDALGDEQIGPRSRMQLRLAAQLAMQACEPGRLADRLAKTGLQPPEHGWLPLAGILLGREGIPEARRWMRVIMIEHPGEGEQLGYGMQANGRPATPDSRLTDLLGAPMNKIDLLCRHASVFDPARRLASWPLILERGLTVLVDMDGLDDAMDLIGAMLMSSLRQAVIATCDGWQERERTVTVACDELSILAGADPRIPEWFREKGRSYGVRCLFATQRPGQLDPRLARSFLGFMTLISFALRDGTTAGDVAAALDQGRGVWTPAAVGSIGTHMCALRTVGSNGMLPVTVLLTPDWDHDASLKP